MKNNDILDFDKLKFGRNQIKNFIRERYTKLGQFYSILFNKHDKDYGFYFEEDGTVRYYSPGEVEVTEEEFYNTFFLKNGTMIGEYSTTCHNQTNCWEGDKCICGHVQEWIYKK